ncbi:MAG TPA: response regulator [Roseiarcus sp.]|nr:response regulator [Roseiarcus sp.]
MGQIDDTLRVLLVEDEFIIALELESQLSDLGQRVVGIAADSEQALEIVKTEAPDLAFVDVNLRDGRTGARVALELAGARRVLVVFLTGSPHHIPTDCAGALGVMTKPWNPNLIGYLVAFAKAYRRGDKNSIASDPPAGLTFAPWLRAEMRAASRTSRDRGPSP